MIFGLFYCQIHRIRILLILSQLAFSQFIAFDSFWLSLSLSIDYDIFYDFRALLWLHMICFLRFLCHRDVYAMWPYNERSHPDQLIKYISNDDLPTLFCFRVAFFILLSRVRPTFSPQFSHSAIQVKWSIFLWLVCLMCNQDVNNNLLMLRSNNTRNTQNPCDFCKYEHIRFRLG